jgi:hypothetical protein
MPEEYDLTLLHPDGKLGRDIAIMRAEIEELHAKLADASCDRPRGTRDHLVDGDNHHLARVVVLRTLMEPLGCGCFRCRGRACIGALRARSPDQIDDSLVE